MWNNAEYELYNRPKRVMITSQDILDGKEGIRALMTEMRRNGEDKKDPDKYRRLKYAEIRLIAFMEEMRNINNGSDILLEKRHRTYRENT